MTNKIPVAVLGATGTVGQRLLSMLDKHPWFHPQFLAGSQRSAGRPYRDSVRWALPGEIPASAAGLIVAGPDDLPEAQFVFSALPSAVAAHREPELAAAGYYVCSNASALRMEPDVPLLIPEINADHVALIDVKRRRRGWSGFVVASPNCSTTGIVFPLHALQQAFGIAKVHAVTMQAISGAGRSGLPALKIQDNVIPHIGGEEEKVEAEPRKLLGRFEGEGIKPADFAISAQTHRVPVSDGHMAALSVKLGQVATLEQVSEALEGYRAPESLHDLPTGSEVPIIIRREVDRPQPKIDREAGGGMAVTVGRLQPCNVLDFKLVSLVHNSVRGAAGGALLNAELLVKAGYVAADAALERA